MSDLDFNFTAELWIYKAQDASKQVDPIKQKGAWYFVTVPEQESEHIKHFTSHSRRGWGSVRVSATIQQTTWKTSIFPDSKTGTFLLPVKADVRKKENIKSGDKFTVQLNIDIE